MTAAAHEQASIVSGIARVLRLGEGEIGRAARLVSLIFALSACLVMIKSAQSGIFLMAYPKTMIPWAFFASAITLACSSLATVPLASRLGAARLLRVTLIACALALLGVRGLLALALPGAPFVLYVVIEAISGVLLIHGWAVVSQATTARSAKRLLPIAGAGATLAWTFVGLAVTPLAHVFGAPALLFFAAGVLVAMVPLVMSVRAHDLAPHIPKRRTSTVTEWKKALAYLRSVPLLRVMASLSIIALVTEQFMDYVLMSAATERYATPAACASFFGRYYGVTSAITLAVLLLLSGRVMLALGTSRTLLLTPLTTIGVAAACAIAPSFAMAVALRSVDRVLKQSIWGSASEQTQTPLPPVERVQSRALVRGVLAPGAYAVTAAILAFMPRVSTRSLAAATALGVALMAFVCTRGVRRAYRDALRRAIDERTLDLDAVEPKSFDADTRATLLAELRSTDDRRAGLAAELLCEGSQPPDDEVLTVALHSPSPLVRGAALRAVARHRRGPFLDQVVVMIGSDPDFTCRAEAARVIVQLGVAPEEARPALVALASEGDAQTRAAAKVALKVLEGDTDPADLLATFDDDSAAIILDTLVVKSPEDPTALHRQMRRLLRRGTDNARLAAVSAAARIKASELLPDVLQLLPTSLGPEVATRIVDWGEEALAYVQDQVDSASAESVRHVATALTDVSDSMAGEAAPLLHRLLAHPDAEVR
ncbi:MAG TPA: HEAT repeat domain-containing protein, partial [Polyangiaceae bacterium]|nr:HEAT repeat domain-containing protein [Polyangiaceae bacterium]